MLDVEPQNRPQTFAQVHHAKRWIPVSPSARREPRQRFGVTSASHHVAGRPRRLPPERAGDDVLNVLLNFNRAMLRNRACGAILFHQTDRPERQRRDAPNSASAQPVQLEAPSAEVQNHAGVRAVPQRMQHRRAHQPRFLVAGNPFELQSRASPDQFHQPPPVARLARGAGRHSAVKLHAGCAPCAREIREIHPPLRESCAGSSFPR